MRYELGEDFDHFPFEFNFLEIKIYLGKQIFKEDNNSVILDNDKNELILKCNNLVGYHRDLIFRDNGEQCRSDTARPDHPIVTYNVGCTRKLRFKWWVKKPRKMGSCGNKTNRKRNGSWFNNGIATSR